MSTQWWNRPVHVALGSGTEVTVNSNEKAASLLLNHWPENSIQQQQWACRALLRSMERPDDPGTLHAARQAFEAAAQAAGILVEEPPKSVAPTSFRTPSWRNHRH